MYQQIFRRRSFHKFKNTIPFKEEELLDLEVFIRENVIPLNDEIKYKIRIVKASETTSSANAEYCILFYSEKKDNYLYNIGYIGEQIDLYCVSKNIGTLWYGLANTSEKALDGLDFVIMMAISKVGEESFRKLGVKVSRKGLDKIWKGSLLNIGKVAMLAPSAVNSQPWFVDAIDCCLKVYQTKPKLGFVPFPLLGDYNKIDIGIFLYILELCLKEEGYSYKRSVIMDDMKVSRLSEVANYIFE